MSRDSKERLNLSNMGIGIINVVNFLSVPYHLNSVTIYSNIIPPPSPPKPSSNYQGPCVRPILSLSLAQPMSPKGLEALRVSRARKGSLKGFL